VSIGGHVYSIERLQFETLFKCLAGFAESKVYGSFSRKDFKMNAKLKLTYKFSQSFVSVRHL